MSPYRVIDPLRSRRDAPVRVLESCGEPRHVGLENPTKGGCLGLPFDAAATPAHRLLLRSPDVTAPPP